MRNHVTSLDVVRKGTSTSAVRGYWPGNDLAKLQGAGFGVLRPIWDLDRAMNADGSVNHTYMDGVLDACARWLAISPINEVVLCAFNGPNTLGWSAWNEVLQGSFNRATAFFTNLAIYIAKTSGTLPAARIWFEFMNEPGIRGAVWESAQLVFKTAVRLKLPSCGILMGFGGASGLSDLIAFGTPSGLAPDKKRRWAFHQYSPWWILRDLHNAPGMVYGLDYDWSMDVEELCKRTIALNKDADMQAKSSYLKAILNLQTLAAPITAVPMPDQTTENMTPIQLSAWVFNRQQDLEMYANNLVRYDAWGMAQEWTMTGHQDAVPFTYEGMYRTCKVARDWELATGESLMMVEGGGGGWAYGSQTPEARATILRLQATQAQVYKDLGWKQWGWWLGNSLFFDESVPGQRQIDTALLASIVDGVAI